MLHLMTKYYKPRTHIIRLQAQCQASGSPLQSLEEKLLSLCLHFISSCFAGEQRVGTWGCAHWDRSVGCGCFLVRLTSNSEQNWRPHSTEWEMQFLCRGKQFIFRLINIQLSSKSPRNFIFHSCLKTVSLYSTGCLQTCEPPASVLSVQTTMRYLSVPTRMTSIKQNKSWWWCAGEGPVCC